MSTPPKTVFLHVGCRKTGTSHLQFGLLRSRRRLARAGLGQPLGPRAGTMKGLLLPLQAAVEGDRTAAERSVADLAATIRSSPHPRHLITLEALAELPPEATRIVVEGLSEFDTRLIVTARSWAHTIPSEWQQRVKSRYTGDYLAWAAAVRDPNGQGTGLAAEAAQFRARQDVADVVRRWRAGAPELPASVVLVPAAKSQGESLVDLFCGLVGVDPTVLRFPDRVTNESLSHADAELLRRVNLELGERLHNPRGNYRVHVRKWLVSGSLMKRPRAKIRLPRSMEAWCAEESARQLSELRAMGCEVLGDPDTYLHPELPGDDFAPSTDSELVATAVELLADLADRHARETRQWKRDLRRAGRKASSGKPAEGTGGTLLRLARRVRRRLGRRR